MSLTNLLLKKRLTIYKYYYNKLISIKFNKCSSAGELSMSYKEEIVIPKKKPKKINIKKCTNYRSITLH